MTTTLVADTVATTSRRDAVPCKDDPKGLLAAAGIGETCADAIGDGCNKYDADYAGYGRATLASDLGVVHAYLPICCMG